MLGTLGAKASLTFRSMTGKRYGHIAMKRTTSKKNQAAEVSVTSMTNSGQTSCGTPAVNSFAYLSAWAMLLAGKVSRRDSVKPTARCKERMSRSVDLGLRRLNTTYSQNYRRKVHCSVKRQAFLKTERHLTVDSLAETHAWFESRVAHHICMYALYTINHSTSFQPWRRHVALFDHHQPDREAPQPPRIPEFQNQKNPDVTADEAINRLFANFGCRAQQTLVCTFAQKTFDF